MEYLQELLATPVWQGKPLGDFLSLESLATFIGSVLAAIAILFIGWVIAAWLGRRIKGIGLKHKHNEKGPRIGGLLRHS